MIVISDQMRQRLLALGILITLFLAFWTTLLGPVWTRWQERHESVERSVRLLAAYRTAIASRPELEIRLRTLQQQGASASGLVEGNSAALAAARLQSDIRVIVEANGGQIRSTQNLPVSTVEDFEKIAIGSDFSVPMSRLKDLVYAIESHSPYLFIDKVEIRMPENWQPVNGATQAVPHLEVRCVISGYRWVSQ